MLESGMAAMQHRAYNPILRIAKAAGVAGVTPNVLRHTAATHMACAGVPLWKIAKVLEWGPSRSVFFASRWTRKSSFGRGRALWRPALLGVV